MAYNYSFADNEIYSAKDLNAITKRLITSGIEDSFSDGVAYNVSRFNEQGNLLYTSGVVPESCLTLKVVNNGEDKILINPGVAFFADGAVIEIEEGGESLSFVNGAKNYVYLKNDLHNKNVCMPVCTTEEPAGDFVLLAEIDENGNITDKRVYAKGKLPGYQSVAENVMRLQKTLQIKVDSYTNNVSDTVTFDLGPNNFQYILVYTEPDIDDFRHFPCLGIYDIAKKKYRSFYANDRNLFNDEYAYSAAAHDDGIVINYGWSDWGGTSILNTTAAVSFELEDNVLTVLFKASANSEFSEKTHTFDLDLILF